MKCQFPSYLWSSILIPFAILGHLFKITFTLQKFSLPSNSYSFSGWGTIPTSSMREMILPMRVFQNRKNLKKFLQNLRHDHQKFKILIQSFSKSTSVLILLFKIGFKPLFSKNQPSCWSLFKINPRVDSSSKISSRVDHSSKSTSRLILFPKMIFSWTFSSHFKDPTCRQDQTNSFPQFLSIFSFVNLYQSYQFLFTHLYRFYQFYWFSSILLILLVNSYFQLPFQVKG